VKHVVGITTNNAESAMLWYSFTMRMSFDYFFGRLSEPFVSASQLQILLKAAKTQRDRSLRLCGQSATRAARRSSGRDFR
jgi:hypothetical protein